MVRVQQQHPLLRHPNQPTTGRRKWLFRLISTALVGFAFYVNFLTVMPDQDDYDVDTQVESKEPLMEQNVHSVRGPAVEAGATGGSQVMDKFDKVMVDLASSDGEEEDPNSEVDVDKDGDVDSDDSEDEDIDDSEDDAGDDRVVDEDDDDDDEDEDEDEDDEDEDDENKDDEDDMDEDDDDDDDDLAMDKEVDLENVDKVKPDDSVGENNHASRIDVQKDDSEKKNVRAKKEDDDGEDDDDGESEEVLAASVALLGERSSGTTWIFEHLTECFEHGVPIRRRLNKYKHWFQVDEERDDYKGTSFETYPTNSLVIAMFRNPYDWTTAMHRVPHHAPAHIDLSWKEFVTKPWTTERVGQDLNITDEEKENFLCQDKFKYHEVVSCIHKPMGEEYWKGKKTRFSEHQPVYELKHDGSGEPYDNILDMRADKIRNFMEVADFKRITDFWVYKYEDLLKDGTEEFLQKIEKATGVKRKCKAAEPQNRRKRPLNRGLVKYLDEHLDWEAEELVGYKKGNRG